MNIKYNEKKREPRHERRREFLLILGSVFIAIAIVEVVLRIVGYSFPVFYAPDSRRGYSLRPGMQGWYRNEGEAYVRINSDGLRDREHAKAKPPNTLRLAVLGDSYAEALQVPFEDSFCAVLERKLRECPALAGRGVEVINFGVSGYGTAQELITLRNNVWQYSPDIVLLAVTTNNDISDNVRLLKKTDQIPYFVWRDGKLVEDDSFLQTGSFRLRNSVVGDIGRWLRDRLRFAQCIDQAYLAFKISLTAREANSARRQQIQNHLALVARDKLQALASPDGSHQLESAATNVQNGLAFADELGIDKALYREPADPIWKDAWSVTEGLIRIMRDEVSDRGATLFVVTLSNSPQVWPDPAPRESLFQREGAKDIFYPDNRIRDFCRREGIPVANLAPAMQKYAEAHKVFLHGFGGELGIGHWNLAGHRVAGEFAAEEICNFLQEPR